MEPTQEQIMQIQMMEQEGNQLNQQLELIEQNVSEMNALRESLKEIESSESDEILANIGKKIFIPVKIREKKLIVDIGQGNLVKKTIPDAISLIEGQIGKLNQANEQVRERLGVIQQESENLMKVFEKAQGEKEKDSKN
ncbi:prefoldin subunit alpha [archaeon]|jgi:prefoldin alpha subunit|nr:prefoldin subunit alpha [archaeon]MBT4242105.1 prefoldin subunit alpha [archaeon]MBT4417793.1 prefoldin subunit alpha [archaeon]